MCFNGKLHSLEQGCADVFCNGQIVNNFGFVGHQVSVATPQLCHCSVKAATDNTYTNGLSSNKTLLMETKVGISYNFHISQNILLLIFFQPFNNVNNIFSL